MHFGSYLNSVSRIAGRGYEPSDEDIVRARLRTMGVQEHRLRFEQGEQENAFCPNLFLIIHCNVL
jgi:hypothetical protein